MMGMCEYDIPSRWARPTSEDVLADHVGGGGDGGGGVGVVVVVVVVVGGGKGQFCSASIQLKKKEDQIQEGRTASYVDGGSHAHHERSELVGKAWTC